MELFCTFAIDSLLGVAKRTLIKVRVNNSKLFK